MKEQLSRKFTLMVILHRCTNQTDHPTCRGWSEKREECAQEEALLLEAQQKKGVPFPAPVGAQLFVFESTDLAAKPVVSHGLLLSVLSRVVKRLLSNPPLLF